jgi:hypothetical protein
MGRASSENSMDPHHGCRPDYHGPTGILVRCHAISLTTVRPVNQPGRTLRGSTRPLAESATDEHVHGVGTGPRYTIKRDARGFPRALSFLGVR